MSWQMPIFDYYPMDVLFDRHRRLIRGALETASRGTTIEEIARDICSTETICPLVLELDDMGLETIGPGRFEARIPYEGDDELWHLYPGADPVIGLDGEVFRGELLLELSAPLEHQARAVAQFKVHAIQGVLGDQLVHIDDFEDGLEAWVHAELQGILGQADVRGSLH